MFHGKFKVTDNMANGVLLLFWKILLNRPIARMHIGTWSLISSYNMYYLMGIQNKVIIMVEYISAKCKRKK